jgi:proline iminopeptidase
MATEELKIVHMADGCAIKVKLLGWNSNKSLMIAHHGAPGLSTHKEPEAQLGALADVFRILLFDIRRSGARDK